VKPEWCPATSCCIFVPLGPAPPPPREGGGEGEEGGGGTIAPPSRPTSGPSGPYQPPPPRPQGPPMGAAGGHRGRCMAALAAPIDQGRSLAPHPDPLGDDQSCLRRETRPPSPGPGRPPPPPPGGGAPAPHPQGRRPHGRGGPAVFASALTLPGTVSGEFSLIVEIVGTLFVLGLVFPPCHRHEGQYTQTDPRNIYRQ